MKKWKYLKCVILMALLIGVFKLVLMQQNQDYLLVISGQLKVQGFCFIVI